MAPRSHAEFLAAKAKYGARLEERKLVTVITEKRSAGSGETTRIPAKQGSESQRSNASYQSQSRNPPPPRHIFRTAGMQWVNGFKIGHANWAISH